MYQNNCSRKDFLKIFDDVFAPALYDTYRYPVYCITDSNQFIHIKTLTENSYAQTYT